MPKGKKICPKCNKTHGARKQKCECGHAFSGKKAKQASIKQTKHPLGQEYLPEPGLWVFNTPKGMPAIRAPEELPTGPLNTQDVYEQCVYNGLGSCVMELISTRKVADPKLRKLWSKANKAMQEVWRYLTDDIESTQKKG